MKMCNGTAIVVSDWEEMQRDAGLNARPGYEGSLISPQMGQHKSCHSSSLHSSSPRVHPAWRRRGNLRMLQVCFPLWPDAQKQTRTVMPHARPGCLRQRLGAALGRASPFLGPRRGHWIAQPTRGVLGQVRAGVFKTMEQRGKTRRGTLQRVQRI